MDTENLKKLLTILDVLDRYKKGFVCGPCAKPPSFEHALSKRLSRLSSLGKGAGGSALLLNRSNTRRIARFDTRKPSLRSLSSAHFVAKGSHGSRHAHDAAVALLRRRTRRAKTLLVRRQVTLRASCPELPRINHGSLDVEGLHSTLQRHGKGRSLSRVFSKSPPVEDTEGEVNSEEWETMSDTPGHQARVVGTPPASDAEEQPFAQGISFDSLGSLDLPHWNESDLEDMDVSLITPKVLGQLFDKVLDCLQTDLKDVIERLQTQNGHLKQDIISVKKRLQAAVETNDEQVQELKDMAERVADLETETRELTRQLGVMESRLKKYMERDRELQTIRQERETWRTEKLKLQQQLTTLSGDLHAATTESRLQRLNSDIEKLQKVAREREGQVKLLQKQLEIKEREVESLSATLTLHQQDRSASRKERGFASGTSAGTDYLSVGSSASRRPTSARLMMNERLSFRRLSLSGVSLAGELEEAKRTAQQGAAGGSIPLPNWEKQIEMAQKMVDNAVAEAEVLRALNSAQEDEVHQLRKELEAKTAAAAAVDQSLKEKSALLMTAEEQLRLTSGQLEATRRRLSQTESDLYDTKGKKGLLEKEVESLRLQEASLRSRLKNLMKAAGSSEEVKVLQDQLTSLEALLEERTAQLRSMENVTEGLKAQIEAQGDEIKKLEEQLAQMESSSKENEAIAEQLEAVIKSLKQQLQQQGAAEGGEETAALRVHIAELEAELATSKPRAERAAELARRVEEVEEEKRLLQRNFAELENQLNAEIKSLKEHSQEQQDAFEQVRDTLTQQKEEEEKTKQALEMKLQQLETNLVRLRQTEERATALQEQLERARQQQQHQQQASAEEQQRLTEVLQKLREEVASLQLARTTAEQEKERLQQQKCEAEAACAAAKQERDMQQQLYEQIEQQLRAAVQEKESQTARLLQGRTELEQEYRVQLEHLRGELEKELEQQIVEKKQLETTLEQLKAELARLRIDNARLHARLEQSVSERIVEGADEEAAAKAAAQVAATLEQLEREKCDLESRLSELQAEVDATQQLLRARSEQLQRAVEMQQQAAVGCRIAEADNVALHAAVEELKKRNERLEREARTAKQLRPAAGTDWQRKCVELSKEIEALKQEMQHLQGRSKREQETLQQRTRHLEEERWKLVEKMNAVGLHNEELGQKLLRTERSLEETQSHTAELRRLHARAVEENRHLLEKLLCRRGGDRTATPESRQLAVLLHQVARDVSFVRGEMHTLQHKLDQSAACAAAAGTTVFNVGFPDHVIPMVNAHGHGNSNLQNINISGIYDVRMAGGDYASFSRREGGEQLQAKLRKARGAVAVFDSFREALCLSPSCCSTAVEEQPPHSVNGGIRYALPVAATATGNSKSGAAGSTCGSSSSRSHPSICSTGGGTGEGGRGGEESDKRQSTCGSSSSTTRRTGSCCNSSSSSSTAVELASADSHSRLLTSGSDCSGNPRSFLRRPFTFLRVRKDACQRLPFIEQLVATDRGV